ncbi:MAG: hypothetical protein ABSA92_14065 [Candidatus Bathyarchaeia archaeon]
MVNTFPSTESAVFKKLATGWWAVSLCCMRHSHPRNSARIAAPKAAAMKASVTTIKRKLLFIENGLCAL